MADLTKLIEQLRDDLQTSEADLVTAKEAASRVPEIEGEIERLQAAMTALGAPQSPSGRKRIAEAQKKRTRTPKIGTDAPEIDAMGATASAVRHCAGCGLPVLGSDNAAPCHEPRCASILHLGECQERHRMFHAASPQVVAMVRDKFASEPRCYECKATGTIPPCPADSCEVNVCFECLPRHNKRWHSEGVA